MTSTLRILMLAALCAATAALPAQDLLDREIQRLVADLAKEASVKMRGRNIAVADFVDPDGRRTELGTYLSEEVGYALVNAASTFKVVDRSQLKRLLDEAGIGDKGLVDPQTVQKLGRLKGISAVVYGTVRPLSNTVRVFAKVVVLEEMVQEINVRTDITRTATIDRLLGQANTTPDKPATDKPSTDRPTPGPATQAFAYQHLQMTLTGCTHIGSGTVDCQLHITTDRHDTFSMQTRETTLTDAQGRSYRAQSLTLGTQSSTVQVGQPMPPGTTAHATVRFTGLPTSGWPALTLAVNCRSHLAFDFAARFGNVAVR